MTGSGTALITVQTVEMLIRHAICLVQMAYVTQQTMHGVIQVYGAPLLTVTIAMIQTVQVDALTAIAT